MAPEHPMRPIEFLVLAVLADGELHGYGIVQAIEAKTDGRVTPKPGNLYRVLDRLHERGLVDLAPERAADDLDGQRRRYYAITEPGRAALATEVDLLGVLVDDLRARAAETS